MVKGSHIERRRALDGVFIETINETPDNPPGYLKITVDRFRLRLTSYHWQGCIVIVDLVVNRIESSTEILKIKGYF